MKRAEEFKDFVIGFFDNTNKTGWGKKDVARQVLGLWSKFLMDHVESQQKRASKEFDIVLEEPSPSSERESTSAIDELRKDIELEETETAERTGKGE